MLPLPGKFVERTLRDLGEREGRALCDALDGAPSVSVRYNPFKCPEPPAGDPVPWSPWGRYLPERPQFTFDSDFHAGLYYVQEAGSQFVGHLLQNVPTEGARILDLCAAPGGKTTLYASLVGPDGLVVANEIDRRRAQVLADNVRKWGSGNVVVTSDEPARIAAFANWFDIVAVDAPCSGEGMFRKDEQARAEWSEGNVVMCAARQLEILREAWRALKPGGTLLYSTCTFNAAENEGTLQRFCDWAGDEVVAGAPVGTEECWGIVCGEAGPFRTFRFYPHRARGEGFFAAVARKSPDAGGRARVPKPRRRLFTAVDTAAQRELERWIREPRAMRFIRIGDICYGYRSAQSEAVRAVAESLAAIASGVAMGQLFGGRLKPDPALAFYYGLNRASVPVAELGAAEAAEYLRRREVAAGRFAEGINLVCARGAALGFAKRIGNRVNNMYPNSLRILKQ